VQRILYIANIAVFTTMSTTNLDSTSAAELNCDQSL